MFRICWFSFVVLWNVMSATLIWTGLAPPLGKEMSGAAFILLSLIFGLELLKAFEDRMSARRRKILEEWYLQHEKNRAAQVGLSLSINAVDNATKGLADAISRLDKKLDTQ